MERKAAKQWQQQGGDKEGAKRRGYAYTRSQEET
jgi:hypothetical protein